MFDAFLTTNICGEAEALPIRVEYRASGFYPEDPEDYEIAFGSILVTDQAGEQIDIRNLITDEQLEALEIQMRQEFANERADSAADAAIDRLIEQQQQEAA